VTSLKHATRKTSVTVYRKVAPANDRWQVVKKSIGVRLHR
jgi:hypothetical protein